jgi:hypothetical protein
MATDPKHTTVPSAYIIWKSERNVVQLTAFLPDSNVTATVEIDLEDWMKLPAVLGAHEFLSEPRGPQHWGPGS